MAAQPPRDHHLEQCILGELLTEPERLATIANRLEPWHFHNPQNQRMWRALTQLWRANQSIDVVTLVQTMAAQPDAHNTDADYVRQVAHAGHNPHGVVDHCACLVELAKRRALVQQVARASELAADQTVPLDKATKLLQHTTRWSMDLGPEVGIQWLGDTCYEQARHILRIDDTPQEGVQTGFTCVDRYSGGIFPSEIVVVCGPSGMGKTAFALSVLFYVARNQPVLLFSQEMSWRQIANRAISAFSGVPVVRLRRRDLQRGEDEQVSEAVEAAKRLKMWVNDASGLSPSDIYSRVAEWTTKNRTNPALVVVDYLQIMNPDERQGSREREVGSIISGLKHYAKLLSCPFLVVSQLSRPTKEQRGKYWEPTLWDLRDSGQIEQDAQLILAIVRPSYFGDRDNTDAKAIVLKNRDGETGDAPLYWHARTATFRNAGGEL